MPAPPDAYRALMDAAAQVAARGPAALAEAERAYQLAAETFPHEWEPHHRLGIVRKLQGRLEEAEAAFRRALERDPCNASTQRLLATLVLADGRFDEGFALYEGRHALPAMAKPNLSAPEWRGEEVAGKRVLIWPEQGFGDQIMFARFAGLLKARGADVTLLCRPGLVRLFEGSLGVRTLGAQGAVDFPDPDFWVMTCSLAWRFGVTPQTVPGEPYLRAPAPGPPPSGAFKVGLVVRGNPGHLNDANRSLPPEMAERLRRLPGEVIDLDPAATGARDFADTATIIDQLDLVVSVDTAIAHLAGAMGKPTWVLLSAIETDWRWLKDRSDSPWYPAMRLYRQQTRGDWEPVLRQVAQDAALLASTPSAIRRS
jgi:tetratricopeptide (TPR) repeat protein